ncbi:MAG: hypothetical protein ACJA2S_005379 [Cyclobacteriaceae bacterium]|jgi:uncharacterized protein YegP (UPF0339 family)
MKAYFSLFTGEDNQFYFNLKAGNHEIILQSEGYQQRQGALNGIISVQENSCSKSRYERRKSKKDEPYFVLKAGNGEIIGRSEMYSSEKAMENGLDSVFENGETLVVDDKTSGKKIFVCDIIVNGREKEWNEKKISFEDLVVLAFGTYENAPNKCYTVTFSKGCRDKPSGSLVKGESVNVKPKMIFNVTATDKS